MKAKDFPTRPGDAPLEFIPEYDEDSDLVIFTCNKDTTFFHGSPLLAYFLATYPLGSGFSPKITTTNFNLQKQHKEIVDDFLISGDTSLTLERYGDPKCAYYGTRQVANMYAIVGGHLERNPIAPENVTKTLCEDKCVAVYKTNHDLKFMYMNHPYNFFKFIYFMDYYRDYIIREPGYETFKNNYKTSWGFSEHETPSEKFISDKISEWCSYIFSYGRSTVPIFQTEEYNFFMINPDYLQNFSRASGKDIFDQYDRTDGTKLDFVNDFLFMGHSVMNRYSTRESDLPLADLYCIILNMLHIKMGGFANNNIWNEGWHINPRYPGHHYEVIFCNVLSDLRRNYNDDRDWQHTGAGRKQDLNVTQFLNRLSKCKIINFNTYSASNFKELSIWTLFVYENIVKGFNPPFWGSATALLAHYVDDYTISKGKYTSQGIGKNSIWDLKKFNQLTSKYPYFVVISNKLISSLSPHVALLKIAIYTYLNCRYHLHTLVCDLFNGVYVSGGIPTDKYKHIISIVETISLYTIIFYNKKEHDLNWYADISITLFLVTIASYIAKQESKQFLNQNKINILWTNSTDTTQPLNIFSKNYNYITNVSSIYVAQDPRNHINNKSYLEQDNIQLFGTYFSDLIKNYQGNIIEVVDSSFMKLQPHTLFYTDKLNTFKRIYPSIDIDTFHNEFQPYIATLSMIISSFGTGSRGPVTITDDFKESISVGIDTRYTNVEYVLNLLKPIIHTIFDEYSNKQYPGQNTRVPRINHNGLNHTRQMFFTAYILINTDFIARNNLTNTDIFWLLLASFCVGIGRYNESKVINQMTITLDKSKWYQIFSGHKRLHPHTLIISNLQVNSLCIFSSILNALEGKFTESKSAIITSETILHLSTIGPHNTKPENKEYEDFFHLITIGHYLDHCRSTTAYSQLDSDMSPWVIEFLRKYNPGSNDVAIKEKYYTKMYEILELTGYIKNTSNPVIPYSTKDNRRCEKYFYGVNEDIMLKYINDFDSLYYDLRKTESHVVEKAITEYTETVKFEKADKKIEKWNEMINERFPETRYQLPSGLSFRERQEWLRRKYYNPQEIQRQLAKQRVAREAERLRYSYEKDKKRLMMIRMKKIEDVRNDFILDRVSKMSRTLLDDTKPLPYKSVTDILEYESMRNAEWRDYLSKIIKDYEAKAVLRKEDEVLKSDKEWLELTARMSEKQINDMQYQKERNLESDLLEKEKKREEMVRQEKIKDEERHIEYMQRIQKQKEIERKQQEELAIENEKFKKINERIEKQRMEAMFGKNEQAEFDYVYDSIKKDVKKENPDMREEDVNSKIRTYWNTLSTEEKMKLVRTERQKTAQRDDPIMQLMQKIIKMTRKGEINLSPDEIDEENKELDKQEKEETQELKVKRDVRKKLLQKFQQDLQLENSSASYYEKVAGVEFNIYYQIMRKYEKGMDMDDKTVMWNLLARWRKMSENQKSQFIYEQKSWAIEMSKQEYLTKLAELSNIFRQTRNRARKFFVSGDLTKAVNLMQEAYNMNQTPVLRNELYYVIERYKREQEMKINEE